MITIDSECYPLLSAEQERDLARRYHAGDRAAGERFLLSNLRLVFLVLRRRYQHLPEQTIEDLFQDGYLGLAHALDKFDPERGYRFSSYAVPWITAYMSRQAASYVQADLSLDRLITNEDGDEWTLADRLPDEQDRYAPVESAIVTQQYLDALDTRSRHIIEQRYGIGTRGGHCPSSAVVGEQLSMSGARVRQLQYHAVATMARYHERMREEYS